MLHVTKQADGGWRIALEGNTAEGDRITAWIALPCDRDPDTIIQNMVGEVLVDMGGKWIRNQEGGAAMSAENISARSSAGRETKTSREANPKCHLEVNQNRHLSTRDLTQIG